MTPRAATYFFFCAGLCGVACNTVSFAQVFEQFPMRRHHDAVPILRQAPIPLSEVTQILGSRGYRLFESPTLRDDKIFAVALDRSGHRSVFIINAYDGAIYRIKPLGRSAPMREFDAGSDYSPIRPQHPLAPRRPKNPGDPTQIIERDFGFDDENPAHRRKKKRSIAKPAGIAAPPTKHPATPHSKEPSHPDGAPAPGDKDTDSPFRV